MSAWWINPALWENDEDTINRSPEIRAFKRLLNQARNERPALVILCVKLERWLIEREKMLDMNERLDYIGSRIGMIDRYGVKNLLDEADLYCYEE